MSDADAAPPAPRAKRTSGDTTEAEAFFQSRLALLGKVMFLLSLAFLVLSSVAMGVVYSGTAVTRDLALPHRILHMTLTGAYGVIWLLGAKTRLSGGKLATLDWVGSLATAALVAVMVGQADTGHAGALELVISIVLLTFVRAVVIPSSGIHTLAIAIGSSAIAIATFHLLSRFHPAPRQPVGDPLVIAITMAIWLSITSATAMIASRIIFGLRREVRVARRVGQYELLEKVGEGGMGVVYRATHAMLRRDTAIKLLPHAHMQPDKLARFEREVRQTARLTHPNTVAVFDYGRTPEGVFYYAMEYLEGTDLSRLVEAVGPIGEGRAVHILRQVLMSLTEAHESGLIHRDIKPANVILTERGGESDVAKVVDFGLVKDVQRTDATVLTGAKSLSGTPMYMAPEAITAPDAVGPAADLYAVAALGYFLVTGTHVFAGATVLEVCAHHLHSEPESLSSRLGKPVTASLESVLLQGLAKDPKKRFESARAFRERLDSCVDVPRWTDADARQWWTAHRDRFLRKPRATLVDALGKTVAVDFDARSD